MYFVLLQVLRRLKTSVTAPPATAPPPHPLHRSVTKCIPLSWAQAKTAIIKMCAFVSSLIMVACCAKLITSLESKKVISWFDLKTYKSNKGDCLAYYLKWKILNKYSYFIQSVYGKPTFVAAERSTMLIGTRKLLFSWSSWLAVLPEILLVEAIWSKMFTENQRS